MIVRPRPSFVQLLFITRGSIVPEIIWHVAAMAAGATDNGVPGARLHYDPRYYAANVLDPDGYSLEYVFKSWQHPQ